MINYGESSTISTQAPPLQAALPDVLMHNFVWRNF